MIMSVFLFLFAHFVYGFACGKILRQIEVSGTIVSVIISGKKLSQFVLYMQTAFTI